MTYYARCIVENGWDNGRPRVQGREYTINAPSLEAARAHAESYSGGRVLACHAWAELSDDDVDLIATES